MKQYEAVVEAMRQNDGYATLATLYTIVPTVPNCTWGTRTPFASIRRILQTHSSLFFKMEPGLWGLVEQKDEVLRRLGLCEAASSAAREEFGHTYYQGLLVEIGNIRNYGTCVPPQDRNRSFLARKLGNIASLERIPQFSYHEIVARANTVDVSWLNSRGLPYAFFEVEHTTDISTSLLKFADLVDFRARFFIVSNVARKREFQHKLGYSAFASVQDYVEFMDYDLVARLHTKETEIALIRQQCSL